MVKMSQLQVVPQIISPPEGTLARPTRPDSLGQILADKWNRLYVAKRRALATACGSDAITLETNNFDDFQRAMNKLCQQYENRGLTRIITSLTPSLRHVSSFTNAITTASQTQEVAALVWSGVQAVIECGCRLSGTLEAITTMMSDMNTTLPMMFDNYLTLFPEREELQAPLRDICLYYIDYCILAVKHLKRNPLKGFFKFLYSSSLAQGLARANESIGKSQAVFDKEVEFVHRQMVRQQHLEITRQLAMSPAMLTPSTSVSGITPGFSTGSRISQVAFPVTTIVDFQNLAFVGRTEDLQRIHDVFSLGTDRSNTGPACVVLHGIGGVGKTQTALQYAFMHTQDYDAIFWVRAETDHGLAATYASIATKLGFATTGVDTARNIEEARCWLETTDKLWLLIFDNVEDIHALSTFWPATHDARGSIIITTQKADFVPIAQVFVGIPLSSLTQEQGARLIFNHLRRPPFSIEEQNLAYKISTLVGGLPLAVVTIAGIIRGSACDLKEFLANFDRSSGWINTSTSTAGPYGKSIAKVFGLAVSELSEQSRALIHILAFLNPDAVPEKILRPEKKHTDPALLFLNNSEDFIEITRELRHRQLVKREQTTEGERFLSIHRSLQWSILHSLSKEESVRQAAFQKAFTLIRQVLPTDPDAPSTIRDTQYPMFEIVVPQVLSLRQHAHDPPPQLDQTLDFALLLRDIGTYLNQSGGWNECRVAMQSVNEILDAISYDPNGWIRTDVEADLGIGYEWIGISGRSNMVKHYERSLEVRQSLVDALPPADVTQAMEIILWTGWTDLACAHLEREQFEDTEDILNKALVHYKRWAPETELPYEHSKFYENMSWVRCWQGKYEEALEYVRHGAKLCELSAGKTSGWTLLYYYHVSHVLFNSGKHLEAITASLEVLRSRIEVFGESHHFTVDSYYSTGAMHFECGNIDEAELMLRKCMIQAAKSTWSEEHQARGNYVLSSTLRAKGQLEEANTLEASANEVQDRMVKQYPALMNQVRPEDRTNRMAIYDQMCPIQSGRFTGRLRYGGQLPPKVLD